MARRTKPNEPKKAELSDEEMRRGIERLKRRISDVEKFDPDAITQRFGPEVEALSKSIESTLAQVFGHGTVEYNRYLSAKMIDTAPIIMGGGTSINEVREGYRDGKESAISDLNSAIQFLEEELEFSVETVDPSTSNSGDFNKEKVFLVHGHDEAAKQASARFLQTLGLDPIILNEQISQNMTIIEKLEKYSSVGYAVVLLTPDDQAGSAKDPENMYHQARPNVILELGYFIGKLGRSRVTALKKGNVKVPSDYDGIVYTEFDETGGWKLTLARELAAANMQVDASRLLSG